MKTFNKGILKTALAFSYMLNAGVWYTKFNSIVTIQCNYQQLLSNVLLNADEEQKNLQIFKKKNGGIYQRQKCHQEYDT